jgi:two-component system response regulator PilR (NtrC family)
MSPLMQVKLLRVLQERRYRRLGGTDEIEADIRVITATNRDLPQMMAEGRFREDLYYRINVIAVQLPPLRERREDIPLLAEHFLDRFRTQMGKRIDGVSAEALHRLEVYPWPGNVRQLENVIERAVALERSDTVQITSLPVEVCQGIDIRVHGQEDDSVALPPAGLDLPKHLDAQEREYVAQALSQAGGRHDRAARLLGITPRQFRYLLDKHGLR